MDDPTPATWELTEDAQSFLDAASGVLAADPVLGTVVATTAQRLADRAGRGEPAPEHPHWFAVARDGAGQVAGVAMRTAATPPHQAYLMPADTRLAESLADLLIARGEVVDAANGALDTARAFVERVRRRTGGTLTVVRPSRLYELGTLTSPDRTPAGAPRPARPADLELAHRWFGDFVPDAERQAGRTSAATDAPDRDTVGGRIAAGQLWCWETDGEPVSMVGFLGPALGVARVAPVFTPAVHRGRGYAGALVAHVSALLRDAGHRVCLFTDLENPVSNALYARLGYEPVVDMAELRIVP